MTMADDIAAQQMEDEERYARAKDARAKDTRLDFWDDYAESRVDIGYGVCPDCGWAYQSPDSQPCSGLMS